MNKQEIRDKVANWLQMIITQVGEITNNGDPSRFCMDNFITKWDTEHNCGTCCCIEGWLPVILPDQAKWIDNISVRTKNGESFYPIRIGIPMTKRLWTKLTIDPAGKDFEVVKKLWDNTIINIREGDLDQYLIFEPINLNNEY